MIERGINSESKEQENSWIEIESLRDNIARIQLINLLQNGEVKFPIDDEEVKELTPVVIAERIIDPDSQNKLTFSVAPNGSFIIDPYNFSAEEETDKDLLAYAQVKNDDFYEMLKRHDIEREKSGFYELQKHTTKQTALDRKLYDEEHNYLQQNRNSLMQSLKTDLQAAYIKLSQQ